MIFSEVALDEAEGCILANSQPVTTGRLKKGTLLGCSEITQLRDAGLQSVLAARLEVGDLHEDAAALQLARALVPDEERSGLRIGDAATGRVNIYATEAGVVEVLANRIHALNAVHPMVTVATVPEWQRVSSRSLVATVKIISYAVADSALAAACHAGQAALRLCPVSIRNAALIQTTVSGSASGGKGFAAMEGRLARFNVPLTDAGTVDHNIDALSGAIRQCTADLVLILTGSATSDILDVAPQALRKAGGEVTYFGMPVDPGNLLFFGNISGRPVIGLPGCARSPAMNGADWVLERLVCNVPVSGTDIARMGVGGLLKEIPQRGRLRES